MKIAVIGAGNIGGTLARGWANAGHEIFLGVRNPDKPSVVNLTTENAKISAFSIGDAVQKAEVILVAAPGGEAVSVANAMGNLAGKIVIDAMNVVRKAPEPYASSYEALAEITGGDVVKCFNSTGYENMADPRYGDLNADMFMAGGSPDARQTVAGLAKDLGFAECYDFGGNEKVSLLESMAMIWINLAIFQGNGRNFAFKVLKR